MKAQPSRSSFLSNENNLNNSSFASTSPTCLVVESLEFLENGPYSFSLPTGQCVGISGQSGVGKSQLLRALADLIPHSGTITLFGEPIDSVAPQRWRSRVLMVPAESAWWHDTVKPHFTTELDTELFNRAIVALGFDDDVLNWHVSRLSTGEKQRLALVRALVLQPQVLLLDEPTSGLDAYHTDQLERLISQLRQEQNLSVLWVSHDKEQLARVASSILELKRNSMSMMQPQKVSSKRTQ